MSVSINLTSPADYNTLAAINIFKAACSSASIAISSGVRRVKLINQIVNLPVERSTLVFVVGAVAGCGPVLDNLHDFAWSDLFEKFKRLWHKRLKVLIPVAEGRKDQDGDIE